MKLRSVTSVDSLGESEPVLVTMLVAVITHEETLDEETTVQEIVVEMILFDFVPHSSKTDSFRLAFECPSLQQGSRSHLVGSLPNIAPDFPHAAVGEGSCTNLAHHTGVSADSWTA